MQSAGDLTGTLFTLLTFILIIILPMVMAYLQAKKDRKAGYMHSIAPAHKKSEEIQQSKADTNSTSPNHTEPNNDDHSRRRGKRKTLRSAARNAGQFLSSIDLLRREERVSEPKVSFSEGKSST